MNINNLPYRPCAGIMLVNDANKVFVGRRIDSRVDAWQMPQGGIDKGENADIAALRELEEEVGSAKAYIIAQSEKWRKYDIPKGLVPKVWGGKYRGQEQMWFLMRFTGNDSDINIETRHPEFLEWKWAEIDDLPDIIVAFKRELYQDVIDEFKPFLEL